jgi:hypothetical protein
MWVESRLAWPADELYTFLHHVTAPLLTLGRVAAVATMFATAIAATAPSAVAQGMRGTVRDSATGQPLLGVAVTARSPADSLLASAVTDADGSFTLRTSHAGFVVVSARRIGYGPITAASRHVRPGETLAIALSMARLPALLDTVRTNETPGFRFSFASRGRVVFERHLRETEGFFFSGDDVLWSRLGFGEFFSKVPGFKIVSAQLRTVSGIPLNDRQKITTTNPYNCISARVDYSLEVAALRDTIVVTRLGANGFGGFTVSQIKGIEVYRDASEAPKEWRMDIPSRCALIQFWSTKGW